jgi:hypothetical protein
MSKDPSLVAMNTTADGVGSNEYRPSISFTPQVPPLHHVGCKADEQVQTPGVGQRDTAAASSGG